MAGSTAPHTLYRLVGVEPTLEAMFDALGPERLDDIRADIQIAPRFDELGVPALLVTARIEHEEAPWCAEATHTTGCEVSHPETKPVGLLALAVDDGVYAIGYGSQGFRLVPEHLKDSRFGLSFATRRVDPDQIRGLVRRTPGGGHTDSTVVPGGAPVWALGIDEQVQMVRSLGGGLEGLELTASRMNQRRVSVAQGGAGLRMPFGVAAEDLVSDIREIARICREERPHKELEFVEHIMSVKDSGIRAQLEEALDAMLGGPQDGAITVAVPAEYMEGYDRVRAFAVKIGSTEPRFDDEVDLAYVLDRARVQRPGTRLAALREGAVTAYGDSRHRSQDLLWKTPALKWLEANVSLGTQRYVLMDGDWVEIGANYLESVRASVERLITSTPSVELPAWHLDKDEAYYNKITAGELPGFLTFDRDNVQTALHRNNGVEVCDLLGPEPENALVMVKRAYGSSALSHLFSQGLVAVQTLMHVSEARARFAQKVFAKSLGKRTIPLDFIPHRVIFAILLKDGTELTADSLFPFSQVTLAHAAKNLAEWGIQVEVVGILAAQAASGQGPCPEAA